MSFIKLSDKISANQKISYLIGLIVGTVLYLILLSLNDWNPILLFTSVTFLEISVITGLFMRFLSGLGITLTYTTFCVIIFRVLSPLLRGKKSRLKIAKVIVFIPAAAILVYSMYTMVGALLLSRVPSYFDLLSMIFGVWSLMVMVYIIPTIRGEYSPSLDKTKREGFHEKASDWRFSMWRRYQSRIKRDYGLVAGEEFERYGDRLFEVRTILSGLLLLPISFILVMITPLTILGIMLWIRIFTLHHKSFSLLERALLIIVTASVAILTTISFTQLDLASHNLIFSISYGLGLLVGLILFVIIITRK